MPTPTAIRVLKDVVLAVAHQAAFGTPALTTTVQKWQVVSSEIDPGYEYAHPRGTTGSFRPKDTHRRVGERPKASLEVLASPKVLPFLWEYALGGEPVATLANGDLSEAGDSGNDLSAWSLVGVRPGFNTASDGKLYAKLIDETPGAGQATVELYKDAPRTQLVASGSAANGNTITLAAQNGSGLSGTVALAAPAASNLAGIVLTIVQVRPQEAGVLSRFFTLWRDHGAGKGLERLSDCAIAKLTRTSEEMGVVRYKVEIVAADYNFDAGAGGTFSPGLEAGDLEYEVHGTMAVTTDMDAVQVAQHALKLEVGIENDLEVVIANAAAASAIVKKGVRAYTIDFTQKLADEGQVVLARGLSDTWESVRIVDSYAARTATFLFDKVKSVEPAFPSTDEQGWDELAHKMQAVEETAASPTAPLQVTLML